MMSGRLWGCPAASVSHGLAALAVRGLPSVASAGLRRSCALHRPAADLHPRRICCTYFILRYKQSRVILNLNLKIIRR
jgi:hypothetical protein